MSTPSAGEARDESSPQATCASLILPLKDATTEIALENKRNVSMRLLRKIYKKHFEGDPFCQLQQKHKTLRMS
jgi:hypothetical protein